MGVDIEKLNLRANMSAISNHDIRIDDFARRAFRDIADMDYIAARLAARSDMIPQFIAGSNDQRSCGKWADAELFSEVRCIFERQLLQLRIKFFELGLQHQPTLNVCVTNRIRAMEITVTDEL